MDKSINAKIILSALEEKHKEDIFIPNCQCGATHSYMDAWAMKKSWTHPLTIAYEIKINRSDYLKDNKWSGYLPFCNEFYFVCPHGVILPDEVSGDIGLMYISRTGTKIYTKKKSSYRNITIPDDLYRYILMSRFRIKDEYNYLTESNKFKFWQKWMENRELDTDFGCRVSKKIRQVLDKKVEEVETENKRLKALIDKYSDIRSLLGKMGFDPDHFFEWDVERKIKNIIPKGLTGAINNLKRTINDFELEIQKLNAK